MLYEAYERKILKIKKIRDLILKFKFLILGVLCVILGAVATLSIIKGKILAEFIPNPEYVYGQDLGVINTKAFMSSSYLEFSGDGYEGWSKEKPVYPGNYKVRTTGEGSFGSKKHSIEFDFTIIKKDLNVRVDETLVYGTIPKIIIDGLEHNDKYSSCDLVYDYGTNEEFNATVTVRSGTISILNEDGEEVSKAYNYNGLFNKPTEVALTKSPITITLKGKTQTYNGGVVKNEIYEVAGAIAPWDTLSVTNFVSLQEIGEIKNDAKVSIKDQNGEDASPFYEINIVREELILKKRPITITLLGKEETYNGSLELSREEYLQDGTLAEGETLSVTNYAVLSGVGTTKNSATINITNSQGENTNDFYDITLVQEKLTLKKRPITITLLGKEETYNGNLELSREEYLLDGALAESEMLSVTNYAKLHGIGYINNNASIAISNSSRETTDFYDITLVQEKLTLKKRPITITLLGKEETYNGVSTLTREEYLLEGTLAEGETLSVTNYAMLYGVGSINNDATITIINAQDIETTDCYDITLVREKLIINKRVLTVIFYDDERVYNGLPLVKEGYEVEGTLCAQDKLNLTNFSSITYVGEVDNSATVTINDIGGQDVTKFYDVTIKKGKLKITKRAITINFISARRNYNGLELVGEYEISGNIATTDVFNIGEMPSITFFGELENYSEFTITRTLYDKDYGKDVRFCYNITVNKGKLTIDKAPITIKTHSAWKYYDATELVELGYDIVEGRIFTETGDQIYITDCFSIIDAKKIDNKLEFSIRKYDEDITSSYDITFIYGQLEIAPSPLTIKSPSNYQKVYDGKKIALSPSTFSSERGLFGEDKLYYTLVFIKDGVENEGIDAGVYTTTLKDVYINNGVKDVTSNYAITVIDGTITINKRPISFRPIEKSKPYDGTPLTSSEYEIIDGSLVIGQKETLTIEGSITNIGTEDNVVTSVLIKDENDKDVTHNYLVTNETGTLKVTKRYIIIAPINLTKTYNGMVASYPSSISKQELAHATWQDEANAVFGNALYLGCVLEATVKVDTDIINVGTTTSSIVSYDIKCNGVSVIEYYGVIFAKGLVTVNPRPIEVSSINVSKVYDKTALVGSSEDCYISKGSLVSGHQIVCFVSAEITEIGSTENMITRVEIIDGNGKIIGLAEFGAGGELTFGNGSKMNYKLSVKNGTLTILDAPTGEQLE